MLNVVCALIIKEGKILACQLGSHSDHPLKWEFPGGKINTGETPEKAIKREIYEELGIEIAVGLRLDSVYYDYGFKQIELSAFVCELIRGLPQLHEHINLGWFTVDELNNLDLVEVDGQLIRNNQNQHNLLENVRKNVESRG